MHVVMPQNASTAVERRIPFVLVDENDLITPEDIAVTGVKVSLSFGGAAAANSTNDIVKIDGASGRYYIELTQSEANVSPRMVFGYLKPTGCARCWPLAQIGASTVMLPTATKAEISAQTNQDALNIVKTAKRLGTDGNTSWEATGPGGVVTGDLATDADARPITEWDTNS